MQIETTIGTTSPLLQWLWSKRQEITNVGKDVEKREHLCTLGGNANGVAIMENRMEVSQKIKTTIWSTNSTSAYLCKENKNSFHDTTITLIPKPDKDITKKRKLQANITDKHRRKNPQKNVSKLTPKIH